MTIVIPSYQRRAALARLLDAVGSQLVHRPALAKGLDLVIVLDGSTDGSSQLLAELEFPVPVRTRWQPNRGRAAARNAGLNFAKGELVLFLDDDMEPAPGWLAHHRHAHEKGQETVVVGPCVIPNSASTVLSRNKAPADQVYERLAATGRIVDREDFSVANTSGPADLFRRVGGFDEGFRGWGIEDVEMAVRLLAVHTDVRFEARALAWHHQVATVGTLCTNARSEAANRARLVHRHPNLLDEVVPVLAAGLRRRPVDLIVRRLLGSIARSPRSLRDALAWAFAAPARLEAAMTRGQTERLIRASTGACALLGAAEGDRDGQYLDAKLRRH